MVAPDGMTSDAGILDGIRILDLSDGIAGPVSTLLLAEAGADVVAVEPPSGATNRSTAGRHTWLRSKRSVVLDLEQPDDRARLDDLLAAADVLVHNHGPTRARELGLDDAALAEHAPATGGLVGALVAGQPPRRRSPGERAPGLGAPRRPRRAAGLPGRPDLPPLPDRQLVRRPPQRDRDPRPPDRTPAHRARRAGAHQHRPGRTGADGDALATGGTALTVPGDGHAEGADRGYAVRVRRRRLVAPDG